MDYIVLEGISLYVFLVLIMLLLIISLVSLICAVLTDRRNFILENLIQREKSQKSKLVKENFILKLKHGELNIDEE